jgi:bacteriocin biosynthesis cyclodehydratase domain-containing protein
MGEFFWEYADRPAFGSEWVLEEPEAGTFLARSESGLRVLRGPLLGALAGLIDGRRRVAELIRCLSSVEPEQIRAALDLLQKQRLITRNQPEDILGKEAAYWRLMSTEESFTAHRADELSCRLIVLDGIPDEECRTTIEPVLCSLGIAVRADAPFRLVVARDYLNGGLTAINQECCREGSAWMLVRPYGRRHWLGPLFAPGTTVCWYCLAWWLTINGWSASAVVAEVPAITRTTLGLAALEAAKWLRIGHSETVEGRIREFDTASLSFTEHQLLAGPRCPYCRTASSEAVDVRATLSPLTGVAGRLELLREWPGVAVFMGECSQKVAKLGSGGAYYFESPITFGVAETTGSAASICLTEALERYSARYQGHEQISMSSRAQLGPSAVEAAALLLSWPRDDEATGWVEATSLVSGDHRFVPAGYVYLGYDPQHFATDTNGCAASDTVEGAVVTGLLESIERDAVALWWYNRARRPEVNLENVRSRRIEAVWNAAQGCGKRVHVLDLTTDFGVPVCVAVAAGETPGIAIGCAAHPDTERAVWKALAEMSAMLALQEASAGNPRHWMDDARIDQYAYLMPSGSPMCWEARPGDAPSLQYLVRRAQALNLDVLTINLTRAELGLPVVRTIVPGLRSFARSIAPGRLYDVPVKLGWIREAVSAEQMNPLDFPD